MNNIQLKLNSNNLSIEYAELSDTELENITGGKSTTLLETIGRGTINALDGANFGENPNQSQQSNTSHSQAPWPYHQGTLYLF